jgi:hypothetical protein
MIIFGDTGNNFGQNLQFLFKELFFIFCLTKLVANNQENDVK